jgi:hypothetical protein
MHVLLQVETGGKSAAPDRLFGKVFSTLTILEPPLPFLYEDFSEEESEEEFLPDDEEIRSLDEEDAAPEDSMSVESEDAGADSPDRSH